MNIPKLLYTTCGSVIITIAAITVILIGFIYISYTVEQCENMELLKAYNDYYKATESLLDTLNTEYNWVDSFDSDYYDCKDKLDKLIK